MTTRAQGEAVLRVLPVGADAALLEAVIALGDANKPTLGLMPRTVYAQRAAAGTLIAALSGDEVIGYALYEIARGRVRLVHLCVDAHRRGQGAARALVDHISSAHPELTGIKVKCRVDYQASTLWPRLGFALHNEVPGRGKDGQRLQVWWRDHGVPNLFSVEVDEDEISVAMDHMVFLDLALGRTYPGAAESHVLLADWVSDRIRLGVTPETLNEIGRLSDPAEQQLERNLTYRFHQLTAAPAAVAAARTALLQHLPPNALSESDLNHVVYAAAAGAAVFVTRDDQLRTAAADAAEATLNLKILPPADVAVLLDQLTDAEKYRPAALRGTGFSVQGIPSGAEDALGHLLVTATGERRSEWRSLLRQLAADPSVTCQRVLHSDGRTIAAWASRGDNAAGALRVPLLRCAPGPLTKTVLRLLLFQLKHAALAAGLRAVDVEDAHLSELVRRALLDDAFAPHGQVWRALVLDVRSRAAALQSLPEGHRWCADLGGQAPPRVIAAMERDLWPAKLLDSALPSYLVSIQPRWAKELFSLEDTLFQRADILGMSREHVYYRAPQGNPQVPARVLWYASGSGRDGIGAVVACSQIVEVVVASPHRLYDRFRHLGVYEEQHVKARARDGRAAAIRFIDTETFRRPVSLERLRQLAANRPIGPLLSPTSITSEFFGAIYREGTERSEC